MSPHSSGQELIKEVGPIVAFFLGLVGLWWRLTAKFARKDLVKVQFKTITDTTEETKKEITKLWGVVSKTQISSAYCEGALKTMVSNKRKRSGD